MQCSSIYLENHCHESTYKQLKISCESIYSHLRVNNKKRIKIVQLCSNKTGFSPMVSILISEFDFSYWCIVVRRAPTNFKNFSPQFLEFQRNQNQTLLVKFRNRYSSWTNFIWSICNSLHPKSDANFYFLFIFFKLYVFVLVKNYPALTYVSGFSWNEYFSYYILWSAYIFVS